MDISAPLLIPMMFDMGLRRFSPMMDRLVAMAMREEGMVRRLFVMLRGFLVMVGCLFGHGPLLWLVRCSMPRRQECGLVTIAQCGTYYLADRRTLSLRKDLSGKGGRK
jgi:hypothetical protein